VSFDWVLCCVLMRTETTRDARRVIFDCDHVLSGMDGIPHKG
jgi:hypothetical protein